MGKQKQPWNYYKNPSLRIVKSSGSEGIYLETSVDIAGEEFAGTLGMISSCRLNCDKDGQYKVSGRWTTLNPDHFELLISEITKMISRLNKRLKQSPKRKTNDKSTTVG